MSCPFDEATAVEEFFRELALARQREKTAGPLPTSTVCKGCGDEIDPARRAAVPQCVRCINCENRRDTFLRQMRLKGD